MKTAGFNSIPNSYLKLLFWIGLCWGGFPAAAQQRTNVLFIVVDDLRPALGCYGDTLSRSPNIDLLASKGLIFRSAYCQQAVCAPSRASFMTGQKPDRTRVWNLETHFRTALPNVITLPQHFKHNGYYSRQIGKIYHDPKAAQDSLSWSAPELLNVTTNMGKYVLDSNLSHAPKATAAEAADVADEAYIDGMVANAAIKELRAMGGRPFFLAVGFRRPHLPFSVPLAYWKKLEKQQFRLFPDTAIPKHLPPFSFHQSVELRGYSDIPDLGPVDEQKAKELIRGYYTAVTFIDEQIGKLTRELRLLGLDKNTLIVLLSDHGFHLGEHGMWGKTTNSQLDTRVPLIIYDPENQGGKVVNDVVQLLDLYATLSERCRLPLPVTDGQSFAGILKGLPYHGKNLAFSQFPANMKFKIRPEVMGYAVHDHYFGYTAWIELATGRVLARELYDYGSDKGENNNVAEDPKYKIKIEGFDQQIANYRKL